MTQTNTAGTAVVMVTRDIVGEVTALSFGTASKTPLGLIYRLDFYCHQNMRETNWGRIILKSHLSKHLALFQEKDNAGQVIIDIFIPKEMRQEIILTQFHVLGLGHFTETFLWRMYFLEEKIHKVTMSKI